MSDDDGPWNYDPRAEVESVTLETHLAVGAELDSVIKKLEADLARVTAERDMCRGIIEKLMDAFGDALV